MPLNIDQQVPGVGDNSLTPDSSLPTPQDTGAGASSPTDMGAAPDPSSQPMTPEQRQELLDMIEKIKAKMGEANAALFAGGNKTNETRSKLLQMIFEMLQTAGVDLNDQQSVNDFIQKLQALNPQLAAWFEASFDALLGTEQGQEASGAQDPNAGVAPGAAPAPDANAPPLG